MSVIQYYESRDPFTRSIIISAAGHLIFVFFLTVRALIVPSEPLAIRSAIRVDMVALPEKVEAPPAPAPQAPPKVETKEVAKPKSEPKPKPVKEAPKVDLKVDPKKDKKEQQDALNKLKAMQALDKIKKQQEEAAHKPQEQEYKGNVVSKGNSLTGLDQIEFDRYFSDVEVALKKNWGIPGWLEELKLRAQIRVMVDENGHIIRRDLITPSGNPTFDDVALSTVDKSSPLPPPPARLRNLLSVRGFVVNFPE